MNGGNMSCSIIVAISKGKEFSGRYISGCLTTIMIIDNGRGGGGFDESVIRPSAFCVSMRALQFVTPNEF